jgi:hypothetical protein
VRAREAVRRQVTSCDVARSCPVPWLSSATAVLCGARRVACADAQGQAGGEDLIQAASKGDLAQVKALLAAKADVNLKADDGNRRVSVNRALPPRLP